MPLQNRVLPDGTIVAVPQRGTVMGNRGGAFHAPDQRLLPRHWRTRQWICCLLEFKGRHRSVMQPRRYTELFFLDEATALAAGHRPCFECRRAAATDFARRWNALRNLRGRATATEMDRVLHAERLDPQDRKRTWHRTGGSLPDHAFIRFGNGFGRMTRGRVQEWSLDGYGACHALPPDCQVEILTPPAIVAVLGAGYAPMLHKSAAT